MLRALHRLGIGWRPGMAFVAILALAVAVVLVGMLRLAGLDHSLGMIGASRLPKVQQLLSLADQADLAGRELRNMLIWHDAARQSQAWAAVGQAEAQATQVLEQGTTLVDQTGETMQEIVTSIKRVTDIMAEINSASREQSAGVTQVGEAVSQMDQVTQRNAALVEQSAAAAESLKQQAKQLVGAVAVFKLGSVGPATQATDDQSNRPAAAATMPA